MKRLLASCFGLGWLPLVPGTWGSLPPAIIFGLMCQFGASALWVSAVMAALAVAGSIGCVQFGPAVIAATGQVDPREVVADELAGQALTFLAILFVAAGTLSARQIWLTAAIGLVLFRVFDVAKPWPINGLQKLPEGWGILADDLMAGVYAGIALLICLRLWIRQ
jgi:phosphatidylglycerophosphatase A